MSHVEKMRRKQPQANGSAATPTAAKQPAAPAAKPPATLRYSCGHDGPLAEVTSKQCPDCRRATAARRAAKANAKPGRLDLGHGRLPDGAVYQKRYDAAAETWTATLAVPGLPVMEATASGSFAVERALDRMYRERLRESGAAPVATAGGQ